MSIQQVGVVGAGTMGNGIAQAAVDRGLKTIDGSLERLVKKKLSAEAKARSRR